MRGTFDNEIKNAIYQQKNAKAATTPMKGSGGKKPFAGPHKAAPKAGGAVDSEDFADGGDDEIAEGEAALTPEQKKAVSKAGGFQKKPANTGKVPLNRRSGVR